MSKEKQFIYVLLSCLMAACTIADPEPVWEDLPSNEAFYDLASYWYLWDVPELDPSNYQKPEDILAQIKASQDRWSSISEYETYENLYEEGQYEGRGFGLKYDENGKLYVNFTYNQSTAHLQGVRRGWEVLSINGVEPQNISDWDQHLSSNENLYEFQTPDGIQKITITTGVVPINAVLEYNTLIAGQQKVGYLAFNDFIVPAEKELDEAFTSLEASGIEELVLDLRYNSGGRLSVCSYLANKIVPSSASGKVFASLEHHSRAAAEDKDYILEKSNQLNINRLFVLVSKNTASASEMIINGLMPYMEVIIIGDENTYGKPVGSRTWEHQGLAFSLISFNIVNANGFTGYFSGFSPNHISPDGLLWPLGHPQEDMLKSALHYIEFGRFERKRHQEPIQYPYRFPIGRTYADAN